MSLFGKNGLFTNIVEAMPFGGLITAPIHAAAGNHTEAGLAAAGAALDFVPGGKIASTATKVAVKSATKSSVKSATKLSAKRTMVRSCARGGGSTTHHSSHIRSSGSRSGAHRSGSHRGARNNDSNGQYYGSSGGGGGRDNRGRKIPRYQQPLRFQREEAEALIRNIRFSDLIRSGPRTIRSNGTVRFDSQTSGAYNFQIQTNGANSITIAQVDVAAEVIHGANTAERRRWVEYKVRKRLFQSLRDGTIRHLIIN